MNKQEIIKRLMALQDRQIYTARHDQEQFDAMLYDVALALDLDKHTAEILAGDIEPDAEFGESGLGIGRIADVDPASETIAIIEAQAMTRGDKPAKMIRCDCGHSVPQAQVMSASLGTACPDCYDRMSG